MRLGLAFVPWLVPWIPICFGQEQQHASLNSSTGLPDQLPQCAVDCWTTAVSSPNCTDSTCICVNEAIQKTFLDCASAKCELYFDALAAHNATSTFCHYPERDRSEGLIIMVIVMASIVIPITIVRLVFNQFFSRLKKLKAEDWTTLAALVVYIGAVAVDIGFAKTGLGRDIWTLSPSDLLAWAKYSYLQGFFYRVRVTLIRVAISFFFLSIFQDSKIRRLLWATLIFNAVFGFITVMVTTFQCVPVNYAWTSIDGNTSGSCVNSFAASLSMNIILVVSDVWMIIIPLSQVRKLTMGWKKKLGVVLMFVAGLLATVILIVRLYTVASYRNTVDPSWALWILVFWCEFEVAVGMICISLPTMRLIMRRLFPSKSSRSLASYDVSSSGGSKPRRSRQPLETTDTFDDDLYVCDNSQAVNDKSAEPDGPQMSKTIEPAARDIEEGSSLEGAS